MSDTPIHDTLQPGLTPDSGPADLAELLRVVGSGQPLWDHLTEGKERAALRASSRALRDLADPLIKRVSHLVLGQAEDDNGPGSIHPFPGYMMYRWCEPDWPLSADQVPRIKSFLSRLGALEELEVLVAGKEGEAQLHQLLQEQGLPLGVTRLVLMGHIWYTELSVEASLSTSLSTCLPNLHHLQLSNMRLYPPQHTPVQHTPHGSFGALAACNSLRSLRVEWDTRCDDKDWDSAGDVAQELSQLTQLTQLVWKDNILTERCVLHYITTLTCLQHLALDVQSAATIKATDVGLLSQLSALVKLELRFNDWLHLDFGLDDLMTSLRKLPDLRDLSFSSFEHSTTDLLQAGLLDTLSLTRLEVCERKQLDHGMPDRVLAEGSLPTLLQLDLAHEVLLDVLLVCLQAAPNLRSLAVDGVAIQGAALVQGAPLQQEAVAQGLQQLAARVAAAGGIRDRGGQPRPLWLRVLGDGKDDNPTVTPQLVQALRPLNSLARPRLAVAHCSRWQEAAIQALPTTLPNLHSLEGIPMDLPRLQALAPLHHLRHLALSSPLEPSHLHTLSALHLTSLKLTSAAMDLGRWAGGGAGPSMPSLKVIELSSESRGTYQLGDWHYLLHAAPNLQRLISPKHTILSAPAPRDSSTSSTADVARLLEETMQKLAVVPLSATSTGSRSTSISLDLCDHRYSDVAPLVRALAPLSRWEGLELTLEGLSSFPLAAAQALVQAVPAVQELSLFGALAVDMEALVHVVSGSKCLRELRLTHSRRLTPSEVMELQVLAPRVYIRESVRGSSEDAPCEETVERMRQYWRTQLCAGGTQESA